MSHQEVRQEARPKAQGVEMISMKQARKIAEAILSGQTGDGTRCWTETEIREALEKLQTSTAVDADWIVTQLEQRIEYR